MPPPSIGRLRSPALAGAARNLVVVTPDVTPSTFSYAFSLLNIPDKSLILKMERVKGIEPSSSAWKAGPSYPEPPQRHKGGAEQTARVRAILADTTAWLKSTWLVR
jgi:hypothetical protein